ncbi:MAG: helix-turn-helix transcriptional regulator [Gammaproteobacteria bacterium]|jgi:DNA-binding XRE family transcriptional regulator|nr:helix-turn-helix transcriptional regulator [Gammaproteobacteria bacterium]
MSVQIIENDGIPVYAVVPIADYRALIEKVEMLDDVAAFDKAEAALAAGEDELVPSDIADSLLANVNAVKVWREYRGMSQVALAEAAGLSQAYIAQIETGKREGRIDAYKAIANVLEVDIDDLV